MKCSMIEVRDRQGNLVTPCQLQETLIDRLRAENAALRRRNRFLQRVVSALGRPDPGRQSTRRERLMQEAERMFGGGQ